jgi:hypothetical protein
MGGPGRRAHGGQAAEDERPLDPAALAGAGCSTQSLRHRSRQVDMDDRNEEGLISEEREELGRLRRGTRSSTRSASSSEDRGVRCRGRIRFIAAMQAENSIKTTCRAPGVSRSGPSSPGNAGRPRRDGSPASGSSSADWLLTRPRPSWACRSRRRCGPSERQPPSSPLTRCSPPPPGPRRHHGDLGHGGTKPRTPATVPPITRAASAPAAIAA